MVVSACALRVARSALVRVDVADGSVRVPVCLPVGGRNVEAVRVSVVLLLRVAASVAGADGADDDKEEEKQCSGDRQDDDPVHLLQTPQLVVVLLRVFNYGPF